ncbi:GM19554 [Drosophila sechellia]|uniref:GM19554 n=1 Tax=Drosophila sechellia TaxID=7238 RepID=B4IJN6_DROSE|nr:GM19554 [Drosophila sechellia]
MNRIERESSNRLESQRNETKNPTMRVDFTSLKHDTEMNFFKRGLLLPSGCGYGCGCGCGCAERMHTQIFTTVC